MMCVFSVSPENNCLTKLYGTLQKFDEGNGQPEFFILTALTAVTGDGSWAMTPALSSYLIAPPVKSHTPSR